MSKCTHSRHSRITLMQTLHDPAQFVRTCRKTQTPFGLAANERLWWLWHLLVKSCISLSHESHLMTEKQRTQGWKRKTETCRENTETKCESLLLFNWTDGFLWQCTEQQGNHELNLYANQDKHLVKGFSRSGWWAGVLLCGCGWQWQALVFCFFAGRPCL